MPNCKWWASCLWIVTICDHQFCSVGNINNGSFKQHLKKAVSTAVRIVDCNLPEKIEIKIDLSESRATCLVAVIAHDQYSQYFWEAYVLLILRQTVRASEIPMVVTCA